MALLPSGALLPSLHGRRLGLNDKGRLVSPTRDAVYQAVRYANTAASTAVSNLTAETAFDTKFTIPKNSLQPGQTIKVKFQGIATSTNSTDTLAIKLYIGGIAGTALLTLAARDVANNDIFTGEVLIVFRTIGASGTFVAYGSAPASPNASGTAKNQYSTASTAIDTTAAQDIVVSATWSVASASNSCRLDILVVEEA